MKNLFLGLLMLAGTASYANVTTNEIKTNETKTELALTTKVSSEVIIANYDDCKWTTVTTIKTTSYFLFGYWVGSSVETNTVVKCL